MEIRVKMLDGKKVLARINEHEVISDQSVKDGGEGIAPNPFQYFLLSTAMCVGFYVNSFCKQRNINTDNIEIIQNDLEIDKNNFYKRKIQINIKLSSDFPEKYKAAIMKTAEGCAVKKFIQALPEFELKLT